MRRGRPSGAVLPRVLNGGLLPKACSIGQGTLSTKIRSDERSIHAEVSIKSITTDMSGQRDLPPRAPRGLFASRSAAKRVSPRHQQMDEYNLYCVGWPFMMWAKSRGPYFWTHPRLWMDLKPHTSSSAEGTAQSGYFLEETKTSDQKSTTYSGFCSSADIPYLFGNRCKSQLDSGCGTLAFKYR